MKKINLPIIGFIAGFGGAALGIGGGIVLVPALVLFFGYDIKKVLGTSLAVAVPISFMGAITHYFIESENIKFISGILVIAGSVAGARIGVALANKLSSRILRRLFALLLVLVGLKLIGVITMPLWPIMESSEYPFLVLLGVLAGSASSLFGIGGGAVMVPAFFLFFGFSMHAAIATSLFVIFPTTLAGSFFHKKFNNFDFGAVKFLIPAALFGAVFGAIVSENTPDFALRLAFGMFMILSSVKLFFERKPEKR